MKNFFLPILIATLAITISGGCSKSSDAQGSTSPKGSVTISSVSGSYSRITTTGTITCTVSAKGVTVNDVMELGFYYSQDAFSKYNLGAKQKLGAGVLEKKGSAMLRSKGEFYVRGYLKTESGTVYSPAKKVSLN